jgi:hypothetical protein
MDMIFPNKYLSPAFSLAVRTFLNKSSVISGMVSLLKSSQFFRGESFTSPKLDTPMFSHTQPQSSTPIRGRASGAGESPVPEKSVPNGSGKSKAYRSGVSKYKVFFTTSLPVI